MLKNIWFSVVWFEKSCLELVQKSNVQNPNAFRFRRSTVFSRDCVTTVLPVSCPHHQGWKFPELLFARPTEEGNPGKNRTWNLVDAGSAYSRHDSAELKSCARTRSFWGANKVKVSFFICSTAAVAWLGVRGAICQLQPSQHYLVVNGTSKDIFEQKN